MLSGYHAASHETPDFPKMEKNGAVYKKRKK